MALISEDYREQNRLLHEQSDVYGSSGSKNAKVVKALLVDYEATTVLDYGCGKRGLEGALPGVKIANYDPAIQECSADPVPADIVVCGDVLEHIEPECLEEVLDHLQRLILKAGFFVIACRLAKKTLPDGRNTHLLVMEPYWWLKKVSERFKIAWSKYRPEFCELSMIVEPK